MSEPINTSLAKRLWIMQYGIGTPDDQRLALVKVRFRHMENDPPHREVVREHDHITQLSLVPSYLQDVQSGLFPIEDSAGCVVYIPSHCILSIAVWIDPPPEL